MIRSELGGVDLGPGYLQGYGCTQCQQHHFEDEGPIFTRHLMFQDKHGMYSRPAAVIADGRAAYAHDREGAE